MRYGYRRVHVLLQREGSAINVKRVDRLYGELSLQSRHKTPKRRVKAKLREDRKDARQIKETWALDFVHDQLTTAARSVYSRSWTAAYSIHPSAAANILQLSLWIRVES